MPVKLFSFRITATDRRSQARAGFFDTPHGVIHTPALCRWHERERARRGAPLMRFMRELREAIAAGKFAAFRKEVIRRKNYTG